MFKAEIESYFPVACKSILKLKFLTWIFFRQNSMLIEHRYSLILGLLLLFLIFIFSFPRNMESMFVAKVESMKHSLWIALSLRKK